MGPAGAKGLTWRGTWTAATSYQVDDACQWGGSSWIAVAPSTASAPPSASWALLAAEGAVGPIGLTGPAGATGAVGPQGPVGDMGPVGPTGPQGIQGSIGLTGATGPQGIQGPIGFTGAPGPQGPSGVLATRNTNSFAACNPPVSGTVNICSTPSYLAGANQTAIIQVSASSFAPPGNHGLGVYPMYSTNGGLSWSFVHGTNIVANNAGTLSQYVSASNSGVLTLTSGVNYTFATGVWDAPGGGWTSQSCPCSTTAIIATR
jgi:Collagen triple helix repeat (20 copies)